MKILWSIPLLLTACAWADETADRTAIGAALNDWCGHAGADTLSAYGILPPSPMSETTKPQVQARKVDFVTGDVALVEAEAVQFGSMIMRKSVPLLFVLKKEGGEWRIHYSRVVEACWPQGRLAASAGR